MAYDINKMPRNLEEWNELITFKTNEAKAAYDAQVAEARAQAEAAYAKLPNNDEKPTLAEYIAQAVGMVELPPSKAYWEAHYRAAGYYPEAQPAFAEPELTPEQARQQKISAIDAETSAAIMSGFDYVIGGETYRFHYDRDDQLNFESGATGCLMKKAGATGLPETAPVNAYRPDGSMVRLELGVDEFLALYGAALAHKAACLEAGGQKKAALA